MKDFRILNFIFPLSKNTCLAERIYTIIRTYIYTSEDSLYFAFNYRPKYSTNVRNGWSVYNKLAEYTRMGIDFDSITCPFRVYAKNSKWETVPTYPQILVIPKTISDNSIEWIGKLCEGNRFPVLTYLHKNGASLWRGTKPIVNRY